MEVETIVGSTYSVAQTDCYFVPQLLHVAFLSGGDVVPENIAFGFNNRYRFFPYCCGNVYYSQKNVSSGLVGIEAEAVYDIPGA